MPPFAVSEAELGPVEHNGSLRNVHEHRKIQMYEAIKKKKKTFEITDKECAMGIFAYLVVSVVAFSFIFEKWPIVDSLYFAVVTL